AFGNTRARDHECAHLFAFTGLQDARAQRTELFAVSRTRLASRNEVWFDARRRNVIADKPSGARRPGSVQSCPSITRSKSGGECRPRGYTRRVRGVCLSLSRSHL